MFSNRAGCEGCEGCSPRRSGGRQNRTPANPPRLRQRGEGRWGADPRRATAPGHQRGELKRILIALCCATVRGKSVIASLFLHGVSCPHPQRVKKKKKKPRLSSVFLKEPSPGHPLPSSAPSVPAAGLMTDWAGQSPPRKPLSCSYAHLAV